MLYGEELVAVVTTGDPLARQKVATAEEIAGRPLLAPPPGFGTRTLLLKAFAKARRTPTFSLELSSIDVLLRMVAAGGGTGIVPSSALWGRTAKDYAVVRLTRPAMKRQIGFLTPHGVHTRPAAEAFMPHMRAAVKSLGD
jgi:DNA-binding transcriptional LysR family regulator